MHDSFYLVAPWHLLLVPCVAGMLLGAMASLMLRRRPIRSRRRRMVTAAAVPATLLAFLSGIAWLASSPGSDGWEDLVDVLWLTIAVGGGGLAFAGGLAGAGLVEWRKSRA